jgi:hypothetical protein
MPRFYDFNVFTEKKRIEKLRYMHRNPVVRGLCKLPEQWTWSSFRHFAYGDVGVVEVESELTAARRDRAADGELTHRASFRPEPTKRCLGSRRHDEPRMPLYSPFVRLH